MSDIKIMVRGAYDIQKLRIMMGNRIVGNFKAKLGQRPGMSEEELEEAEKTILNTLRASYKKITDGVTTLPRQATFKGDEGLNWVSEGGRVSNLTLKELGAWRGNRGDAGTRADRAELDGVVERAGERRRPDRDERGDERAPGPGQDRRAGSLPGRTGTGGIASTHVVGGRYVRIAARASAR